jgi:predicted dehydrogenase
VAVYGSEGSIIWRSRKDETLTLISKEYPEGKEIKPRPLPKGQENAPAYFATCVLNDKPIEGPLSLPLCRDVQEILEAGYRSIESKKEISLPI